MREYNKFYDIKVYKKESEPSKLVDRKVLGARGVDADFVDAEELVKIFTEDLNRHIVEQLLRASKFKEGHKK